jgi:hypothetical protein
LVGAVLLLALVAPVGAVWRSSAQAVFAHGDDWRHVKSTLAVLGRTTPRTPVVYLLGGSSARESVTTEPAWRSQIAAFGGGRVTAYNLGAASQSFSDDIKIVQAMPRVPSIVVIGLNVGRYTSRVPVTASGGLDLRTKAAALPGVYDSHRFHAGDQLADGAKAEMASLWVAGRYPVFKERYRENAAELERLLSVCRRRGFSVVLVELPVNESVIGHAWDAARLRYRRDAKRAARAAGVRYVDLAGASGLQSSDFADLNHLVDSGRVKYQHGLSRLIVAELRRTGLRGWRRPSFAQLLRSLGPLRTDHLVLPVRGEGTAD